MNERDDYAEPGPHSNSQSALRNLLAPTLAVTVLCAMALAAYLLTPHTDDEHRPPRPSVTTQP